MAKAFIDENKSLMRNLIKYLSLYLVLIFFSSVIYAVDAGTAAANTMVPVTLVTTFLEKVCGLIGVGFIVGALLQYKSHRTTPTLVPLSRCIILLLLGLGLLAIPFVGNKAQYLNYHNTH